MFLVSFAVAFGLWFYVVTFVDSELEETFYNVPVVMENEMALSRYGLILTSDEVPMVTLKIRGKRSDMLRLTRENITIKANLAAIYESGTKQIPYAIYYPFGMPADAFTVVNQQPSLLELKVEKRDSKEIPVVLSFEGTMPDPENFICDTENVLVSQETVNVVGPASVVAQITQAKVSIDMTGREEGFSEDFVYTLCDKDGDGVDSKLVTTDTAAINLSMQILRVKEIPLKVNVISGGGATQATSEIKIDPPTIKVSGTTEQLQDLNKIELGTIDLSALPKDTELKFVIKTPEGVNNLTNITEATVNVNFPYLMTKTFNVTNIQAINVPEGLEHEIVTKEVGVQIRGPKSMVENLKPSDITIIVDFEGGQKGTVTMPVAVKIDSGYADVGALGSYTVTATLREAAGG